MIARDLPKIKDAVSSSFFDKEVITCLNELATDADPDVQGHAEASLKKLQK